MGPLIWHSNGRYMRGFTLPELLLAASLGLLITWGMVDLNANSLRVLRQIQRDQEAHEGGRFALDRLRQEIRLAGFFGSGSLPSTELMERPSLCFNLIGEAREHVFAAPLDGRNNLAAGQSICGGQKILEGTDVLLVRSAHSGIHLRLSATQHYVVATPPVLQLATGSEILNSAIITCCDSIRSYQQQIFYVTEDRVLRRKRFLRGAFRASEPLADAVDNFQVRYGVVTDALTQFMDFPQSVGQWSAVRFVDIYIHLEQAHSPSRGTDNWTSPLMEVPKRMSDSRGGSPLLVSTRVFVPNTGFRPLP